ncbi:MAG: 16S rRNA (adenine(1518)-N(6)/adenine(1519)-N(6))-dimethyltransferase RsmA [Planctomycetaceae bacterium]
MRDVQRQTRSWLMELFTRHGFNPRGDLGQNFLIDVNLIEFAVRHASLGPNEVALEVGSGTGGMTAFLAEEAGHVISVDVDQNMSMLAAEAVEGYPNVTLLNQDILKNKNTLAPEICDLIRAHVAALPNGQLKLVANLPYSVATPVIANLIASDLPWERMVCTIQWELGEKMAAEHGTSGYSALSVWIQSQASIRILRKLGPNVFWPRPKVDSAIVSIWRDKDAAARINDRKFFLDFLRRAFSQRRKLIRPVLIGMYRKELDKADVDCLLAELEHRTEDRAEQMDIATLIRLSNRVHAAIVERNRT